MYFITHSLYRTPSLQWQPTLTEREEPKGRPITLLSPTAPEPGGQAPRTMHQFRMRGG